MMIQTVERSTPASWLTELPPLGMDAKSIAADFRHYFSHTLGRDRHTKYTYYMYEALVLTLRDRLWERWKNTRYAYEVDGGVRRAYYLSMEFLMGRALSNAILNLGVSEPVNKALYEMGLTLEELVECENDAGLGNGGLGRLAACFMDSCATLRLPVVGYGIRYAYGMFRQRIENGYQVEVPDHWLGSGILWDLERPEYTQRIKFGGRTEGYTKLDGTMGWRWLDTHDVLAMPYDFPIPGYQNGTVNTLRLWAAAATDEFDFEDFNAGSYTDAVGAKNMAENITMVLYPNDATESGKELRLRQQYFLASASLQDVLRQWVRVHGEDFSQFAAKNCFQLNDTHPTIAVAELMRLLMDEHNLGWDESWNITRHCMAYTNHTLLPEALERWSVRLFRQLLPRLLDIIYEINARFLVEVASRWPGDIERQARMSLIEEGYEQQVRMAYLAIVGSFSVNGVAALHSDLLKQGLFRDFYELWPEKFNNKTNGVTQRRWMAGCNPGMSALISETIGPGWVTDLDELRKLAPHADDPKFRERWRAIKHDNKVRLASLVEADCGVVFNPKAMFDVQVKRMHEYKRQLLNALHVVYLYDRLKHSKADRWTPRCVLIGGKAAPGYYMAKQIIKLINNIARVINNDSEIGDNLKLAFLPNYRVSAMEIICPGTDLSEQISTAGKEASGTGNMKFMMNGAVTIGTLDGANIEIREEVGDENFFLFGMTAQQVEERRRDYNPVSIIQSDPDIARIMHLLESGHFNQFEQGIFDPILHSLTSPHDPWLTIADLRAYINAQEQASLAYQDQERWAKMSILNTAFSGKFSTDRTMEEYNSEIWKLKPIPEMPIV
ncbi:MAG: glycogen/starch/alpha-glucan phosphorylase [Phycisphaerales bacterium]|nr:glycogen/starch/alpha-glucan phosphorylase [Phycisphaerales bacterium]